ncbi:MAG: PAS domain S-box protein [Rubrobacteraceae bacterium]
MEERDLLRTLIDSLPDFIFIKDTGSRFVTSNAAHRQHILRNVGEDELVGKTDFDFYPREQAAKYYADEQEVIRSGRPLVQQEKLTLDRSGECVWLSTTKVPLRDGGGKIVGLAGTSRDITLRKQAEEALRDSEERYRAVVEQSADGIWLFDPNTKQVLESNICFQKMLGYTAEELRGMTNYDFVAHGDEDVDNTVWRKVREGEESAPAERKYRRSDGTLLDVEVNGTLVSYGDKEVVCSVARDITQRKEVQQSLEENEQRYRSLFDHNTDAVYSFDLEGNFLTANPACEKATGYTVEELLQTSFTPLIVPENLEKTWRHFEKAVSGEPQNYENAIIHKDGHRVELSVTKLPVVVDGEIVGVYGIAKDDTGRKQAEAEWRESEARFRALFDQSTVGVCVADLDRRLIETNAAYQQITGYSGEELVGMTTLELTHPEDRAGDTGVGRTFVSDESDSYRREKRYVRKDGEVVWAYAVSILVRDGSGEPRFIMGVVEDVTERKRAEEEIRQLNEELEERVEQRTGELRASLKKHERSTARESALRSAGAALVAAPDRERIYAAALEAVLPFIDEAPGTRVSVWSGSEEKDVCVEASGDHAAELEGKETYISELPDWVRTPLLEGQSVEIRPGEAAEFRDAFRFKTKLGSLFMVPIYVRGQFEGRIAVASDSRLPGEIRNALQTLGSQVALALERADLIENLHQRRSEERFRSLIQNSSDIIAILDENGAMNYVSPTVERVSGHTPDDLVGSDGLTFVHPDDVTLGRSFLDGIFGTPEGISSTEMRMQHADGSWRHVELRGNNLLDEPTIDGVVINFRDITGRKRSEEALKASEERYRTVVERATDGIHIYDFHTKRILETNTALQNMLGYTPEELLGRQIYDLIADSRESIARNGRRIIEERSVFLGERRYRRKDGSLMEVETSATVIPHEGREAVCTIVRDITERKALEKRLEHQAFHDPLTGLPNRRLFMDRIQQVLARVDRHGEPIAVLFLDLDNFKVINDSLGHAVGDRLLAKVAHRLKTCLRPEDTVARLGGDEFIILLEIPRGLDDATLVAERIAQALQAPFVLDGHEVSTTASIGIALGASSQDTPGDLLRNADFAMYRVKEQGKANYEVFDPSMSPRALERLKLENDLKRAIERGEFVVHYQPQIDLSTGEIVGVEALVRWNHPGRGLVLPDEFIPLAEETGQIIPIGNRVLEKACRQARAWREQHNGAAPLKLCVNLSARQVRYPRLVQEVTRIIQETGVDLNNLNLEITESVAMEEQEDTFARLSELKQLGIELAIDDFGTGYSSLSYLKRLPVDVLKIDKSFVWGLGEDHADTMLVSAIIELAHALGLETVAEGVETAEQLEQLRNLGCDIVQGNYLMRVLTSEEMSALIEAGLPVP